MSCEKILTEGVATQNGYVATIATQSVYVAIIVTQNRYDTSLRKRRNFMRLCATQRRYVASLGDPKKGMLLRLVKVLDRSSFVIRLSVRIVLLLQPIFTTSEADVYNKV